MSWRPPRTHRNLPDPVTSYAVLGERNSGTNYVDALLAANLPAGIPASDVYCWKHGFIDRRVAATGGLLTVVVYRHPVRWLQSLHNKPMELSARMQGLSFGDFIRHEWQGAFARPDGEEPSTADMDPKARTNYPNALRLRAAKIAYLEEMAEMPGRVAFLRFEDANRDPRATLDALGRAFDLPLAPFTPVQAFKGSSRRSYAPRLMPAPGARDLAFIRDELDENLEARIGYCPERPPRFDGLAPWDRRALRAALKSLRPGSGGTARRAKG